MPVMKINRIHRAVGIGFHAEIRPDFRGSGGAPGRIPLYI